MSSHSIGAARTVLVTHHRTRLPPTATTARLSFTRSGTHAALAVTNPAGGTKCSRSARVGRPEQPPAPVGRSIHVNTRCTGSGRVGPRILGAGSAIPLAGDAIE